MNGRRILSSLLAVGAMLVTAIPAGAATSIGSATSDTVCAGTYDLVQMATGTTSYAVPAGGGFITDWSTTVSVTTGSAGLLVWRPTATPGTYTLVAAIAPVAMPVGTNTFVLATPIPVQAGDVLGLHTEGRVDCATTGGGLDTIGYETAPTVAVGADEAFITDPATLTLDVAATVQATLSSGGHPNCNDKPTSVERDNCDKHDNKDHGNNGDNSGEQAAGEAVTDQ